MHVAVVGGGIFGQVIAWRLALRGAKVTVVEPLGPGNAGSGSGDRSRIVRALYDEPCFAEAGFHGLRLWDAWSLELGVRLVEAIGVVYLVRKEGPGASAFRAWVDKGIANVRGLGGAVEEMTPAAAAARWPAMATGDLESVAFEPGGGYGRAALATRTIARASAARGVTHLGARVVGIEEQGGKVTGVRWEAGETQGASSSRWVSDGPRSTRERGTLAVDAVVVASGFAGAALVEPFCGALPIVRLARWASYWDVPWPEGAALHQSVLPAWADLGAELYGFPDDGESGFKCASHAPRPEAEAEADADELEAPEGRSGAGPRMDRRLAVDGPAPGRDGNASIQGDREPWKSAGPSEVRRRTASGPTSVHAEGEEGDTPDDAEVEALREKVAVRFPAIAKARCRSTYVCAYDSTADERFQIGEAPAVRGLWFVGGMSGHGFKHAPSLGESVAASVVGSAPMLDLAPYALRVSRG